MMHFMRRHGKIIFAVVGGIVIISFVFWGAPGQGAGSGSTTMAELPGIKASGAEKTAAWEAFQIPYLLRGQNLPQVTEETLAQISLRVVMLRKVAELGIEVPDAKVGELGMMMTRIPPRKDEEEQTYRLRLQTHFDELMSGLATHKISRVDFDRYVREELALNALQKLVAAGSKTTPDAVKHFWEFANETATVRLAHFKAADYLAKVTVTDDEARKELEKDPKRFAIPEKLKVRYFRLDLEATKKEVAVTNEELLALYTKNPQASLDEKGQPKPFDAVKAEIESQLRTHKAYTQLIERARKLFGELAPAQPEAKPLPFADAAKAANAEIKETDFFALDEPIAGVKGAPRFATEVHKLRDDFRIATPVTGEDGVYLAEFIARQPRNENPEFVLVKEKVISYLRELRSYEQARDAAQAALKSIRDALGKGTSFDDAAKTLRLTVTAPPPFTLRDRIADVPEENMVKEISVSLNPGDTSEVIPAGRGTFLFLHLTDRKPAEAAKFITEQESMKRRLASVLQDRTLQEWARTSLTESGYPMR